MSKENTSQLGSTNEPNTNYSHVIKSLTFIPCESSTIDGVMYRDRTLFIKFKGGSIYSYHPFTSAAYRKFLSSESQGKYFHAKIKHSKLLNTTKLN